MSDNQADHAGVRVPPPLIFLGLAVSGPMLDRLIGIAPLGIDRTVAIFLVTAFVSGGLAIVLAAIRGFARAGTRVEPWAPSSAIVTCGVYRVSRNPMYLGMALVMVGLALILQSPMSLVMVALAVLIVDRFVIRREEAYLEAKFGAPYSDYRRRVRRWL